MSEQAWINCKREMPSPSERVEVLYLDGVIANAKRANDSSYLFIMDDGLYRYVDPVFWRPIAKATT